MAHSLVCKARLLRSGRFCGGAGFDFGFGLVDGADIPIPRYYLSISHAQIRRNQMLFSRNSLRLTLFVTSVLLAAAFFTHISIAQNSPSPSDAQPYVIEYYYKAKWGHADEFLSLFKKNHLPVLKKETELGRILHVTMASPRYHNTEDGRWDFRVTITFKNAAIANDNFDSVALTKQLFPDQDTFKKEEQRRFEILDAHWDLPLKDVPLDSK